MSVGDVWQEHRRFITTVGAGALILLIGHLVIGAVYTGKAQRLRSDIDRYKSAQRQSGLPQGADIKKIQADRERLDKDTSELIQSVAHKPADKWLVGPAVADADLHYNQQIDTLKRGALDLAAIRNIDVDSKLGLPDQIPASRADFEHYLRGLSVVEALIGAALRAEQVHEGGIVRIEKIEIARPPKARAASERKVPFVTSIKVDMTVVGHPKAVDFMLKTLAADTTGEGRGGQYLAVEEAAIRSLDVPPGTAPKERRGADPADRRRVECKLTVLALNVNPEGQVL
jgi:hypothetical protein